MSLFEDEMWYIILNKSLGRNSTLNSGVSQNTNGSLAMGQALSVSSSENWQFFFQNGRYFIRNWDYRSRVQLGVDTEDRLMLPTLVDWQTDLSQQWLIEKQDDGYFVIRNEVLSKDKALGIGIADSAPQMTTNMEQSLWMIDPNLSAVTAGPVDDLFLAPIQVVEPEPTSATTSIASSSPTGTATSSNLPSTTGTTSPTGTDASLSSNPTSTSAPSTESSSISTGAIAGIAVGAVALIALALIAFFIMRRRKRSRSPQYPNETTKSLSYHDAPSRPGLAPAYSDESPDYNKISPAAQERVVYFEKPGNSTRPGELESPPIGQGEMRPLAELDGGTTRR